jgi:DNA helicase-2/ATP-dependent DNA helicase PcrA
MDEILQNLNSQQIDAVTATEGPVLVVAGPGSGKTRVLTYRAALMVAEKKIDPQNLLLLTFTNKAANEMRERAYKLMSKYSPGNVPPFPWAGTFHATCSKILRKDGYHIGIPPSFVIYDESDSKTAIQKILKDGNFDEELRPGAVLWAIDGAKNELISADEYPQYAYGSFQEAVAKIYPLYQKLLAKNKALDFGDLIMKTVQLFQEAPQVLEKYQNKFQYILVDEYQDTNHAQYVLTKMLSGKHQNICVVGDMDQSIYSWRGANYRNLLQFERDFPEARIFRLEQNYRSTPTIINAAKEVISHNNSHLGLDLFTENEEQGPIKIYEALSESDEAHHVIGTITTTRYTLPATDYSSFAVLYRTNAQSRALEEIFLHSSVPYKIVGGIKFYDRKEIKDILSYLRLVQNPMETVSLDRIEKLGKRRAQNFNDLILPKLNLQIPTLDLLDIILQRTGYVLELERKGTEEDLARVENIKELRSVATRFDNLSDFLENVALVQQEYLPNQPVKNEKADAVTLMTLHAAKGLEFPTVFIVGMEEGLLPHSRSLYDQQELEEERRLCYVGMTRAMRELHLTHCSSRLYFGSRQSNLVSRFIEDIPEELMERV